MPSDPPPTGEAQGPSWAPGKAASAPPAPVMPRVLAFYRDTLNNDGTVIGWQTIAWGVALGDGSVVSMPVGLPVSVTLWSCLGDAASALDAYVDTPDPRRLVDTPLPSRASTDPPQQSVDGTAVPTAFPGDPPAGEGRDRPLGPASPVADGPDKGGRP